MAFNMNQQENPDFGQAFSRQFQRGIGVPGDPTGQTGNVLGNSKVKYNPTSLLANPNGGMGNQGSDTPQTGGLDMGGVGGLGGWRNNPTDQGGFGGGGPMPVPTGGPNWRGTGGAPPNDGDQGGPHPFDPLPQRQQFPGTGQGANYWQISGRGATNGFAPDGSYQDPVSGVTYNANHPNNPNSQAYKFLHSQNSAAAPGQTPPLNPGASRPGDQGRNFGGGGFMGGQGNAGPGQGGGGMYGQQGSGLLGGAQAPGGGMGPSHINFQQGAPFNFNQFAQNSMQNNGQPQGGWNWGDLNNLRNRRF